MDFKTATDNIAVDKASGDIWLAGLVKPYAVIDYLTDPSNPENTAPSQVTHKCRKSCSMYNLQSYLYNRNLYV